MRFNVPDFTTGQLELRFEDGEVAIYGTPDGILRLSDLLKELVEKSTSQDTGHIHLEDRGKLTKSSCAGVIAVFNTGNIGDG